MCDAAGSSRKFPPLFFSPVPVVYIAFKEAMVIMRSHFLRHTPALKLCFHCNLTCEAKGALAARLPLRSRSRFSFFRLPASAHSWVCDGRSACAAILAGSVRPCSVLHQHTLRPPSVFSRIHTFSPSTRVRSPVSGPVAHYGMPQLWSLALRGGAGTY